MSLPPPPTADPERAQEMRRALEAVGYTPGPFADAVAGRLSDPGPLATACRLFALGEAVTADAARSAFGERGLAAALGLGACIPDGDLIRATLRVVPHDILFLASDLPATPPLPEHVAAAHDPSLLLARLTIRRRVARALDLGTGNGVQALLLSAHADVVVATDVNERALRFTEFNAALNGRTNIETRRGNWLDPVTDERFGCIVCSPPYVISPESHLLYRDAGVRGDVLCRYLVHDLPTLLDDGGFATVLVSWVPGSDEPEPLAWPPDGCSALVLRLAHQSAEDVAAYWHSDLDPGDARAGVERWLGYYRTQGIDAIDTGAVVVQRTRAAHWREWLDLPEGPRGSAGAHLERIFAAAATTALPHLAWAPDVRITRADGVVEVSAQPGLGFVVELDEQVFAAVESASADETVLRELCALGLLVPRP